MIENEISSRGTRRDDGPDLERVMQVAGYDTSRFSLHRDPVAIVAGPVRKRVRALDWFVVIGDWELDGKVLPRSEIRQRFTIFGLENERHDVRALASLLDKAQLAD